MLEVRPAYRAIPVNIGAGEQFDPAFLAISPNNKIPAIVDPDGPDGKPISLFESGAILLYLAAKTGRFLPADTARQVRVLQWLMFQMGGVGPLLGQAHHFRLYAPGRSLRDRPLHQRARRLYRVMDRRIAASRYLGGPSHDRRLRDLSWLRSWKNQGIDWADHPHLKAGSTRSPPPAVMRGVEVLADRRKPLIDDKARETLFGATQYRRH